MTEELQIQVYLILRTEIANGHMWQVVNILGLAVIKMMPNGKCLFSKNVQTYFKTFKWFQYQQDSTFRVGGSVKAETSQ